MRRTNAQLTADQRAAAARHALATDLRRLLADAGVSQRAVAAAAGLAQSYVSEVFAGEVSPTLEAYHRIAAALSAGLSIKLYPGTGPRIHDRWQAPMLEATLHARHPRWQPFPEAMVTKPERGWIDLLLHEPRERVLVASELQSELRRLEQLIRWHGAKAESLPSWSGFPNLDDPGAPVGPPSISRLLIVRATRATRQLARDHARQLRATYPAHPDDALAALAGTDPWPGAALVWMAVDARGARFVSGR